MDQARLKSILHYCPDTGVFTAVRGTRQLKSKTSKGYLLAWLDGNRYRQHRLAWLYVYGEWPRDQLDHINGDPSDNRISNLREATRAQNSANAKLRSTNKTGFKGVFRSGRKWAAQIRDGALIRYLGSYSTPEDAHAAFAAAHKEIHGEFSRT